jgi:hypothetical protein
VSVGIRYCTAWPVLGLSRTTRSVCIVEAHSSPFLSKLAVREGVVCEWVMDCSDLYMCPCATASRIALVELRGNGVVAGRTGPHEPSSTWHKSPLTPRLHRRILTAT